MRWLLQGSLGAGELCRIFCTYSLFYYFWEADSSSCPGYFLWEEGAFGVEGEEVLEEVLEEEDLEDLAEGSLAAEVPREDGDK